MNYNPLGLSDWQQCASVSERMHVRVKLSEVLSHFFFG